MKGRQVASKVISIMIVAAVTVLGCDVPCQPSSVGTGQIVPRDILYDVSADGSIVIHLHGNSVDGPTGVYFTDVSKGDPPQLLVESTPDVPFADPTECRLSEGKASLVYSRPSKGDIFAYDIGSGVETRITFTNGNASEPDWSPDGRKVFSSRRKATRPPAEQTGGLYIHDWNDGSDEPILHGGKHLLGSNPM